LTAPASSEQGTINAHSTAHWAAGQPSLEELDQAARDLNVSRQAVIKTLVRQALDQHYLANRLPKLPDPRFETM
jgi:hypothetical protein